MAFTLQVFDKYTARIDDVVHDGGSLETPVSYSVTGNTFSRVVTIANGSNTTVYANDLGESFNFMSLASDVNTRVKVTDNASNTFSLNLRGSGTANEYGVPLTLAFGNTVNSSTIINALQVFNSSGSSAKVRLEVIA